jgi:hypothetical protein
MVASYFHRQILDTLQLTQFISRTPKLKAHCKARVYFSCSDVSVSLTSGPKLDGRVHLEILCSTSNKQLSSLAQVCGSSISQALVPWVECLVITPYGSSSQSWIDDRVERGQWLDLLRPFSAVERLFISQNFVPCVARALKELGDRVTEVLPALRALALNHPLSEPVQEMIDQFVTARELAGHPIAISHWL